MSMFHTKLCLTLLLIINGTTVFVTTEYLSDDLNELKQVIERKAEEVKRTCDKRYHELERKFRRHISRRDGSGGIAFSAQLTVQQTHTHIGTVIKFNKVLINDGSGYNNQTGVFIAPEAGVYMFSYFIGNGNKIVQSWVKLMHNGKQINSAVTDTFHTNEDLQGGNTALIRMAAGDRVWIETFHQDDAYIDGHHQFSSFSGIYWYY